MTFLFLALGGGALVVWLYHSREVPVSGSWLLASARVLSLAVLMLLLWNPTIPRASDERGKQPPWLLLDASLSMTAGTPEPWRDALDRARNGEWGGILLFGGDPRPAGLDTLQALEPRGLGSRLGPALQRAAEAGARRVVVVSDFRIQDSDRAGGVARDLGLSLEPVRLDTRVVNAGVAEVSLPVAVDSGAPVPASVTFFAEGVSEGDSLELEVREEGRLVASRAVPPPGVGRLGRVELTLPGPGGSGFRRYVASVSASGDAFPDDDRRPAWVEVDPEEGGVLLLSLRPDWEPRFLLPVLERVTGLSGEAFFAVGQGHFMTSAEGGGGPRILATEEVRRRLGRATILVVHGLGGDAPAWAEDVIRGARRVVALPLDPAGAALVGLDVGPPLQGEWYPARTLPPSPLAGNLAGEDLSGLPPLSRLLPLVGSPEATAALMLDRRGSGPPEAGLALLEVGGSRRAVVLGQGLWRWGFREGAGREAYEALWSGVAGWLLEGEPMDRASDVRPRDRVVPRGAPVRWRAPETGGDTLRLRLVDDADSVVADTLVTPAAGAFVTGSLPPGTYSFSASPKGDSETVAGAGRFDVELFSDEMMAAPAALAPEESRPPERSAESTGGRPLRTHPLPYLLVLGLLCAEWIGRRRTGLR